MIRRAALLIVTALLTTSCAALGLTGSCDGTEIIGKFEQVGDLVQAGNVQSSDVVIGSITEIELDKAAWTAQVTMCLDESEKIPRDLEAVVRITSLLGEKFIDLKPQSTGGPYLEDGDIIDVSQTSKATELEDVFARLAAVLGTGNLEQINRFTASQAEILREHSDDVVEVLHRLRRFTDVLAGRRTDIAASIDSLDDVAKNALGNSVVLERFLDSFGEASGVLADQKEGLQQLLISLERFSDVSIRLLDATEEGLHKQFRDLRPILRTAIANSENISRTLVTFATFTEWFPETMPGDYLQLDVCQAPPETYTQGKDCKQSDKVDDEDVASEGPSQAEEPEEPAPSDDLRQIYELPLGGKD